MKSIIEQFNVFFQAIHKYPPFPWQWMLAQRVAEEGWPDVIDLPTASGKTACIDIAVFALSQRALRARPCAVAPRRIWFVVDRRIVVDEAFARAQRIAVALRDAHEGPLLEIAHALLELGGGSRDGKRLPLATASLRGGAPRKLAWTGIPTQPVVLTSTVDQIGSRLLFRGYGSSPRRWPMDAALVGNDSLIILDEAHCAKPFMQTVHAVATLRQKPWGSTPPDRPFHLATMSATPPGDPVGSTLTRFPADDNERSAALHHKLLDQRAQASKCAQLLLVRKSKTRKDSSSEPVDDFVSTVAQQVMTFTRNGRKRIAVMVNRIATARDIHQHLKGIYQASNAAVVEIMTGRMRPIDRDFLVTTLQSRLKAGSTEVLNSPIILVTTQCLEVGADYSFDALVTECASLDSLRQRFGRLDRLGEIGVTEAAILFRERDFRSSDPDCIYGQSIRKTWSALNILAKETDGQTVDMGISALREAFRLTPDELNAPSLSAPILLPAYIDLLSQTNPRPTVEPDVAIFLHGYDPERTPRPDVHIVWRVDIPDDDAGWIEYLKLYPPLSAEMLSLPLDEFLRAIRTEHEVDEGGDVEGELTTKAEQRDQLDDRQNNFKFAVYRGPEDIQVFPFGRPRPNDRIVLRADSPLFSKLAGPASMPDLYEIAHLQVKGFARLRLNASVLLQWYKSLQSAEIFTFLRDSPDPEGDLSTLLELLKLREETTPLATKFADVVSSLHTQAQLINDNSELANRPSSEVPIAWELDDEADELMSDVAAGARLIGHLEQVASCASHLTDAARQMVEQPYANVIVHAARLHDIGKCDSRMQTYLAGRKRVVSDDRLLAKSSWRFSSRASEAMRIYSTLPRHFRHEMVSMQMLDAKAPDSASEYSDLLLHLIASHHGYCRPFAPDAEIDVDAPAAAFSIGGAIWSLSQDERRHSNPINIGSGVCDRFWILTRRFGWWGLAYLEMLLRASDQYASSMLKEPR